MTESIRIDTVSPHGEDQVIEFRYDNDSITVFDVTIQGAEKELFGCGWTDNIRLLMLRALEIWSPENEERATFEGSLAIGDTTTLQD